MERNETFKTIPLCALFQMTYRSGSITTHFPFLSLDRHHENMTALHGARPERTAITQITDSNWIGSTARGSRLTVTWTFVRQTDDLQYNDMAKRHNAINVCIQFGSILNMIEGRNVHSLFPWTNSPPLITNVTTIISRHLHPQSH
jgi:hypothetical protein